MPKISVVMSVYNSAKYLRESIESILGQTFRDFEFIIVDDGSTDDSINIIDSFKDPRIRIIKQENRGLASALNQAIKLSAAPLIARMDADDIALPERLRIQFDLMSSDAACIACGSWADIIDADGEYIYTRKTIISNKDINNYMSKRLISCMPDTPFLHSSVSYRKEIFFMSGGYSEHMRVSEDVVLFNKMRSYGAFRNIPKVLIKYRIVPESMSGIRMNSKKLGILLMMSIKNEKVDESIILELKRALRNNKRERLFNYNIFLAKKFLFNNYKPEKARKYLLEATKIKFLSITVPGLLLVSFLFPERLFAKFKSGQKF